MTPLAILQHIIVWIPLVIGGILLIRAGLRGRRVNDHPICRRCRFDLVGLAGSNADATSHPDRCPECGTELTGNTRRARRAVINGERRKRWPVLALGLALLLSGLTTGFWLSYKPLAKFPWTTWMPDWVLAEMVDSPNAARSKLVAQEILHRIRLRRFASGSHHRAVQALLHVNADPDAMWTEHMGDIIEGARAAGQVGDDAWATYASNSVALVPMPHDPVEPGEPLRWMVSAIFRAGSGVLTQKGEHETRGLTAIVEPQVLILENGDRLVARSTPFPIAPHMGLMVRLPVDVAIPHLPPSEQRGTLVIRVRFGEGFDKATWDLVEPVSVERLVSVPVKFTVVATRSPPSHAAE
ncbi:MAG: hypothetical protein KF838_12745 [Phycisphaeraceae bacterium]|nr:MAG: hypothetical protein KF838_12745 [Phycisphaeraceae bacterium]